MTEQNDMSENQQFCLRWNNHHSTLVSVFSSLLDSNTFADCTLVASGKQAKVHKMVLSACSPYLKDLLVEHTNAHPIIILDNVKSYELEALVEFMYCGEVNILQEHLEGFLKAADSLQIKGLSGDKKDDSPNILDRLKGEASEDNEEVDDYEDEGVEYSRNQSRSNLSNCDSLTNENLSLSHSSEPPTTPIKMENFDYEQEESKHMPGPVYSFPPGIGSSFYGSASYMLNHMSTPVKHDTSFPQCNNPDQQRPRRWHLTSESVEQEFKCEVCNKRYRSKTSLNLHKRWECGREPQFQCPFCLKKTHQKGLGLGDRGAYECQKCGRMYRWKSTLKRHEEFECGGKEPTHCCPFCDYKAKQKGNLKVHVKRYHPDFVHLLTS